MWKSSSWDWDLYSLSLQTLSRHEGGGRQGRGGRPHLSTEQMVSKSQAKLRRDM